MKSKKSSSPFLSSSLCRRSITSGKTYVANLRRTQSSPQILCRINNFTLISQLCNKSHISASLEQKASDLGQTELSRSEGGRGRTVFTSGH